MKLFREMFKGSGSLTYTGESSYFESSSTHSNVALFFVSRIVLFYLIVGALTRIVLLFNPSTVGSFNFLDICSIFGIGILNDLCFAAVMLIPFLLLFAGWNHAKYRPLGICIIEAIMLLLFIYIWFFNSIFKQYGSALSNVAKGLIAYKLISYNIRLFVPQIREKWSSLTFNITMFIYVTAILLNAVSEYFFWSEFGVRYNFIAVDYLIYTNEVIGNIMQSYHVVPMSVVLLIISALAFWLLRRKHKLQFNKSWTARSLATTLIAAAICATAGWLLLKWGFQHNRSNVYVSELRHNGCYSFLNAFSNSELDYKEFYPTADGQERQELLSALDGRNAMGAVVVQDSVPAIKKNIVLITVESLSASFLAEYGNTEDLTPELDSLIKHSLVFDNLYATGNRTVRGLEAVTLCLPPSSGESIVKRKNNANMFSTGHLLAEQGYSVQYLYGGKAYFDNMKAFFGGNGYEIIDQKNFKANEITFSNIWGVCDEDMYALALRNFDTKAKSGKPFFAHIMTVSNHRPYTYPRTISLPDSISYKSREGALRYTDYAIGKFLREAAKKPWFANTVFVIVADHCAASAGKTSLPVENYHIPALVYAPGFIKPQRISTLCSQIDLMPTVFALLHLNYTNRFYGRNVLSTTFHPRAFMATYQDLGYLEADTLTVLSPIRQVHQFKVTPNGDFTFTETPIESPSESQVKRAIAYYQTANTEPPRLENAKNFRK